MSGKATNQELKNRKPKQVVWMAVSALEHGFGRTVSEVKMR